MASHSSQSIQRNSLAGSHEHDQGEAAPQNTTPPAQNSATPSMTSEDSQTVLLNNPSSSASKSASALEDTAPPRPSMPPRSSTLGIKKCWICICDSTEDDPAHPEAWRSPCTCNLTAHESCLLDWVADLENPKNRKRSSPLGKILCPQCKSEIKIARPRNLVVDGVRIVDRALGRMVLPGVGVTILGTVWAGAFYHGVSSIYVVFGPEHATFILNRALKHRGWISACAFIPFNLIFARTSYSDFVLPTGTLFLLATQLSDGFEIDMTIWPPLPSTVFACLPALRAAYNLMYEKAFGALNRKWIQEVQPRQSENAERPEDNAVIAEEAILEAEEEEEEEEGRLVLELQVNIGANRAERGDAPVPVNAPDANPQQRPDGEGPAVNPDQAGVAQQLLGQRQDEIVEGTSGLGQTILGALLFPSVAAGMGGLLSYALPTSWISGNSNFMNGRPGLLRMRWGRSVVGGCLFVVLKDALVLYCRWKLAQSHRKRKVMDYDKKTKRYTLA